MSIATPGTASGASSAVAHGIASAAAYAASSATAKASAAAASAATSAAVSAATSTTPWTPERIERLRDCVKTGLTCSQIASEIGVSRNAVIGKIHRLGLSSARPAPAAPGEHSSRLRSPRQHSQRRLLRLLHAEFVARADVADGAVTTVLNATPVDSLHPCSLLELGEHTCRWPLRDGSHESLAFCGNDVVAGFSYCAGHARMAYRFPARRRA